MCSQPLEVAGYARLKTKLNYNTKLNISKHKHTINFIVMYTHAAIVYVHAYKYCSHNKQYTQLNNVSSNCNL